MYTSVSHIMFVPVAIAISTVLFVLVVMQIVYIRVTISKYADNDYYKQALELSPDPDAATKDRINGMNLYSLQFNPSLTSNLNRDSIQAYVLEHAPLPKLSLPILYSGATHSMTYSPKAFSFIVFQKTAASEKLLADVLTGAVTYLTFAGLTCPVTASQKLQDAIATYAMNNDPDLKASLLNKVVLIAVQPPKYDELIPGGYTYDSEAKYDLISFTGSSLTTSLQQLTTSISNTTITHVLGYRV